MTHYLTINRHNGQTISEGYYLDNDAGQYKPKAIVSGLIDFMKLCGLNHNIMIDAEDFVSGEWQDIEPEDFALLVTDLQDEIANHIDQADTRDKHLSWHVDFHNAGINLIVEDARC